MKDEALLRTSAQDLAVLSVTDLQHVVRCSWLAAAERKNRIPDCGVTSSSESSDSSGNFPPDNEWLGTINRWSGDGVQPSRCGQIAHLIRRAVTVRLGVNFL
jgi:hypothetical protein